MITLGLTGSIGMGKSTVAAMFAADGIAVFDSDAAVHRLQGRDSALLEIIESTFPGTTGLNGVNRVALGAAVFGDEAAIKRLEAIMHPAVERERAQFVAAHLDRALIVFDVPLLFETGGDARVDKVAVVSAPLAVQRARVLARPGQSEDRLAAVLARQLPDAEKRARADFIIPTGGTFDETRAAVRAVIACLLRKAGE